MATTFTDAELHLKFYNYFNSVGEKAIASRGVLKELPNIVISTETPIEDMAQVVIQLMQYSQSNQIDLASEILRQINMP